MRVARRLFTASALTVALGACLLPQASQAQVGPCCVMSDNGGGTADHPPSCPSGYAGHLQIISGLPVGSTIQIPAILGSPGGFAGLVQVAGGGLGGNRETWTSSILFQMSGTGAFLGYNRILHVPVTNGETHSAPRVAFNPLQSFNTDLYLLQGQLPPGDPDFDLLRITAGTGFGMPSPGHTTLTAAPGGWAVDSFFDVFYRIDFVGAPGGPFSGMSGSTTAQHRFEMCHSQPTSTQTSTWGRIKQIYR